MGITYVADTSPINIDIVDKDKAVVDLSASGFDVDLPNSLAYIRKIDQSNNLFTKAPIVNPNGTLALGNLRVEISKTDFASGNGGVYYIWCVLNDVAGTGQLTHSTDTFEVRENPT